MFILPELKKAAPQTVRKKAHSRESKSLLSKLKVLSWLICYWSDKKQMPPTIDEMAEASGFGYSMIQRSLKLRYPDDKCNKQFRRDYLTGELIRELLTNRLYKREGLPADVSRLLSEDWDDKIRDAASSILTATADSNIQKD